MSVNPTYALVCSGGGVTGAYQVGVLKYIHEFFCRGGRSPFQIFSGVSCGALNAAFSACEAFQAFESRLLLERLWEKFHVPEYHQDILRSMRSSFFRVLRQNMAGQKQLWSLFDSRPMMDIIEEGYRRENLERSFQTGATLGVAVVATEILHCFPCWFVEGPRAVEWKRFHSIGLLQHLSSAHVAASCSIPFFMPPVRIGDHYFLDGSVKLERPFSAAISMGATRILHISTRSRVTDLPQIRPHFEPKYSTLVRFVLKTFTQDSSVSEIEQIRVANRFAAGLHRNGNQTNGNGNGINALFDESYSLADYQPIEIHRMVPSKSPESLFQEFQAEQRRSQTQRCPSNFMFHRDFIKKLIRLGYEEAKAQHEVLERFFGQLTPAGQSRPPSGRSGCR